VKPRKGRVRARALQLRRYCRRLNESILEPRDAEKNDDGDALIDALRSIIEDLRGEGLDESRLKVMLVGAILSELLN